MVAEFYWRLFQDTQAVKRCLQKAFAAATTDDHLERIAEFLKKLGLQQDNIVFMSTEEVGNQAICNELFNNFFNIDQ